ncbi:M56 family metallopeptidase [Bacteroidota bacterium]
MNLLSDLFSEKVINALGWDIFHILWQGFLIAVVLGIVLRFIKHKYANIKYLISFISLILLVGLSVFNFTSNYDQSPLLNNTENYRLHYTEANTSTLIDLSESNIELSQGFVDNIKAKIESIDKYFPIAVNLWIIGVFVFTLKFILSFLYTSRLKSKSLDKISDQWFNRFKKIEDQLKIRKAVGYVESQLIKIPLVLGYFKPVIVIPTEMLTGIPSNQIEAIIAHELAHIRRNDYILNVLQTIIETLLFFHPAVWYISSQIRKERENSCDDMALTVCDGSLVYAKALVSVQELTLRKHYSAVAFSGRKKHLLNRIKRMIMKPKVKSNFTDKIIAAVIILSGILALSFTYATKTSNYFTEEGFRIKKIDSPVIRSSIETSNQSEVVKIKKVETPIIRDTLKIKKNHHSEINIDDNTVIRTYRDDNGKKKEMKFLMENGKVTELFVNGKEIPESEYDKYQAEIDETIEDIKEAKVDIREAMKDIEELDIEKIQLEVQEAMKDVHIDMEEIQEEITKATQELKEIDIEDLMNEVEMNLEHLEDLDFDFDFDFDHDIDIRINGIDIDMEEIREEMEKAREAIHENIDIEEIQKELQRVQEELSNMDKEQIRIEIEEGLEGFEEFDKEKIIKDLEEKLEELEKLELEEE